MFYASALFLENFKLFFYERTEKFVGQIITNIYLYIFYIHKKMREKKKKSKTNI